MVVIAIHEYSMETFKKPEKKVFSKREVIFPPMMYIYYLYMFLMIIIIYLKSHALRYILPSKKNVTEENKTT